MENQPLAHQGSLWAACFLHQCLVQGWIHMQPCGSCFFSPLCWLRAFIALNLCIPSTRGTVFPFQPHQLFVTFESVFGNCSSKTITSSVLNATVSLCIGIRYVLIPSGQPLTEFLLFPEYYLGCHSRSFIISSCWLSCDHATYTKESLSLGPGSHTEIPQELDINSRRIRGCMLML